MAIRTLIFTFLLLAVTTEASAQSASTELFRQLLARPAPPPRSTERDPTNTERPESFFDEEHPPADDAPINELFDYWSHFVNITRPDLYRKVTPTVIRRLLDGCEAEPPKLERLLPIFPELPGIADRLKRIYDSVPAEPQFSEWRQHIRLWLEFHSTYFIDALTADAADTTDRWDYVDNEAPLRALLRLDRERALPVLLRLSEQGAPITAALATVMLYQDAIAAKNTSEEEGHRARLLAIAEDHNAPAKARDTVIEALSKSDWPERDDWYLRQFSDLTLLQLGDPDALPDTPLTLICTSDPDKWIPVMARLVDSTDPAVRQNAASCLVHIANKEPRRDAFIPVLRWLTDPDWLAIDENTRIWFIEALGKIDLPESIPGLIWLVENEPNHRPWTAQALVKYHDSRAVPVLRQALAGENHEGTREGMIECLLASGGLDEAEQVAGIEAYATELTTPDRRAVITREYIEETEAVALPVSVGRYFANRTEVPDSLAVAVLARADQLQASDPPTARALLEVAQAWSTPAVDLDLFRRIGNGTADAASVESALQRREKLAANMKASLASLTDQGGFVAGVAAAILSDETTADRLLNTGDEPAQVALLACSRLTQLSLPVAKVGRFVAGRSPLLALAAEKYLLAEDSREAREILWKLHPDQGFLTGWRDTVALSPARTIDHSAIGLGEERLRAELFAANNAPSQIFALLNVHGEPAYVLRAYKTGATFTSFDNKSRFQQRPITRAELNGFRSALAASNFINLGPQLNSCDLFCESLEFLDLRPEGGRRVFSHQEQGAWAKVVQWFEALRDPQAPVHYLLQDEIKGAEVLVADRSLAVQDVWQDGEDIRVRVERAETEAEIQLNETEQAAERDSDDKGQLAEEHLRSRIARAAARITWRRLEAGRLGGAVPPPPPIAQADPPGFETEADLVSGENTRILFARSRNLLILAGNYDRPGLWRKSIGQGPVRITDEGDYADPVVTPDGGWVVATKSDTSEVWRPQSIVRVNLRSGREYKVDLPAADRFGPVKFLPAQHGVLLRRARSPYELAVHTGPSAPEYYLLDPESGVVKPIIGEFEPLVQETTRYLQPTGKPGEVWAAIPDEPKNETRIGRYCESELSFQTVMTVPHLVFNSMNMRVDEAKGKIYIVFEGQLISVPLAPNGQSK